MKWIKSCKIKVFFFVSFFLVPPPTLVLSESESSDEEAENGAQIKRSAVKGPNRSNQDIQNTLLCEDSGR